MNLLLLGVSHHTAPVDLRERVGELEERVAPASPLIGESEAMGRLRGAIARLARIPSPVLVLGESGTGKELVARELHRLSPRRDEAFVAVNCGGISEGLVDSDLFGHQRGAFTGAVKARRGAFDELNLVQPGGWYGFPNCIGAGEGNSASADVDCANSIPPVMRFGGGAVPTSLAAYTHDTLPGVKDTLIIVLSGAPSQIDFVGYKVIMINFDEANRPLGATVLIPFRRQDLQQAYAPYRGEALYWNTFIHISELGFGFYPNQPLAVAVEPRGWIYISMTGGRIIALRPRQAQLDYEALYPIWTPMNPKFDPSEAHGD